MSSAVQYLHSKGIVAVDCSTSSFVITRAMIVKLSHLAVSWGTLGLNTAAVIPIRYASPETLSDGTRIKASDIFTLGSSLWYLMTGSEPFPLRRHDSTRPRGSYEMPDRFDDGIDTRPPPNVKYHCHVLQTLISDCCKVVPSRRPNIDQVVARLGAGKLNIRGTLGTESTRTSMYNLYYNGIKRKPGSTDSGIKTTVPPPLNV